MKWITISGDHKEDAIDKFYRKYKTCELLIVEDNTYKKPVFVLVSGGKNDPLDEFHGDQVTHVIKTERDPMYTIKNPDDGELYFLYIKKPTIRILFR